jgi:predicted TIM-barrel fold metal-dependent hydrolase
VDIVDAQLHMGPASIEATLAAMDAVGIQSVMLEEFWHWVRTDNPLNNPLPGFTLPNGAWRAIYPTAQLASALHPERFSYFVRMDRCDPQLDSVMRVVMADPGARAVRFLATRTAEEADAFMSGGYDQAFEIAQDIGAPVCLAIPGYVEYLPRYLRNFPRLQFVVDHWGMGMGHNPSNRPEAEQRRSQSLDYLDEILKLAEAPNVVIKISHAQMLFGATEYPYEPLRPILRRAIQAFGADRLLWSSDRTVTRPAMRWSDLVHYLRDDPELSRDEKEQILGRNSRRVFGWPVAA